MISESETQMQGERRRARQEIKTERRGRDRERRARGDRESASACKSYFVSGSGRKEVAGKFQLFGRGALYNFTFRMARHLTWQQHLEAKEVRSITTLREAEQLSLPHGLHL